MRRRRRAGEEGSATTQLVIAMPALLIMLMLVVQIGLWFHASHIVHAAAQEGARAARVEAGTPATGQARAHDLLAGLGSDLVLDPAVTVTRDGDAARVEITATTASVVPGFRLPLHATSEGPIEEFRAP